MKKKVLQLKCKVTFLKGEVQRSKAHLPKGFEQIIMNQSAVINQQVEQHYNKDVELKRILHTQAKQI